MATPSMSPFPAPTPYQPPAQGGNPYLKPGAIGPMIGTNAVPTGQVNGVTTFNTGAQTYSSNIKPQGPAYSGPQPAATPQTPSQPSNNPGYAVPGQGDDVNAPQFAEWRRIRDQGAGDQQALYDQEINRLIDEEYGAQMGYLGAAEQNLRNDFGVTNAELERQQKEATGQYGRSRDLSMEELTRQAQDAEKRKVSKEGESRRTYDELRQGATQRFGGSSSAGEAAYELLARQQMQDQQKTAEAFQGYMQEIEGRRASVNNEYSTAIEKLNSQVLNAKNTARADFQNKLLEIERMRAESTSQKNSRKLEALQNYRNQVFQIEQDNAKFAQQLDYQRQLTDMELNKYAQQLQIEMAMTQAKGGEYGSFMDNYEPGQQYRANGATFKATQPVYIGSIGKYKVGTDSMGRNVYSDGTSGNTQYDDFGNPIMQGQVNNREENPLEALTPTLSKIQAGLNR